MEMTTKHNLQPSKEQLLGQRAASSNALFVSQRAVGLCRATVELVDGASVVFCFRDEVYLFDILHRE